MAPNSYLAPLRRTFFVWLVWLVAVFGAVAPTLSHALVLARGGSSAWTEVCTSTGTRWELLDLTQNAAPRLSEAAFSAADGATLVLANAPDGQESAVSLDHCPFCLLFAQHAAPAPSALSPFFVAMGPYQAPTVRRVLFAVTHDAFTPPPRGPPVVS